MDILKSQDDTPRFHKIPFNSQVTHRLPADHWTDVKPDTPLGGY